MVDDSVEILSIVQAIYFHRIKFKPLMIFNKTNLINNSQKSTKIKQYSIIKNKAFKADQDQSQSKAFL